MPFAASGTARDRKGKSGIFRQPEAWKEDTKAANVIYNAVDQINPQKMKVVQGSVVYVALEVAVSKLLRRIMSADTKSLVELAAVHTISLGFMGGIGAGLNNPGEKLKPYALDGVIVHAQQGAKGVIAVYLAQYIYNVFFFGVKSSFFSMKDALIIAAAKVLTRPIAAKLYDKAKFLQNSLDAQQLLEEAQGIASNFARIGENDRFVKPK